MTLRNKIYFIIIAASYFIAVLFVLVIAANAEEAGAHAVEQEIVTGPGQHDLSLISSQPWLVEGEVLGTLAAYVYKDVTTERPIDYWELYDKAGDLLAVGWFDKFGIERTAVDRGILEEKDKLEGIFVLVLGGTVI
jgi:hypothetical protein